MSSSGRLDPAVPVTAIATAESRSVIGVETPGLQRVLSWRSSGSIFSDGTDPKRGVLHRMELRTKEATHDFTAIRDHLTACVEMLEEAKEEIGLFYQMPPPEIVRHRGVRCALAWPLSLTHAPSSSILYFDLSVNCN